MRRAVAGTARTQDEEKAGVPVMPFVLTKPTHDCASAPIKRGGTVRETHRAAYSPVDNVRETGTEWMGLNAVNIESIWES